MTQIKLFQVDILIDQENHRIVLRSPSGESMDITNCVRDFAVDEGGLARLSVVATTRKCIDAKPKKTERAGSCSLHPRQAAVFHRGIQCRCGETVLTLALCELCRGVLDEDTQAEMSLRNYNAIYKKAHEASQFHQDWDFRVIATQKNNASDEPDPAPAVCPFCKFKIRDIWAASTSGGTEVVCPQCGQTSKIERVDGGYEVKQ